MTTPNHQLSLIERRFSVARLSKYRQASGGSLHRAFKLYEWNVEMSTAFWATIGHVEILMRNAMHGALSRWAGTEEWYLARRIFTEGSAKAIDKAQGRVRLVRGRRPAGKVVAELPFDFWRFLLISSYDRSLWQPCLSGVWGRPLRRDVEDLVAPVYNLRNRIAHHEPIHHRDLAGLHHKLNTLGRWTCPTTATWIADHCRIAAVLARRP